MSSHDNSAYLKRRQEVPRTRSILCTAVLLSMLGGCADFPASTHRLALLVPESLKSDISFSGPSTAWPIDRWWENFEDVQLSELIREALAGSPDMALAGARLRQAESVAGVESAAVRPQVSANGSISSQKQSKNYLTPSSMVPDGWKEYGRTTIDLSWDLDFWGQHRSAIAAASSEADARRADLAQAVLTLSSGIALEYAELSRLFAARDTSAAAIEVRRMSLQLFSERFANGLETLATVKEAQARFAAAEGDLIQLDEQIGLERNKLALLLGAGPDRANTISRPKPLTDAQLGLPAQLAVNLLGRRPDIAATRLVVEAKQHKIEQKRAEFYPNVNLAAFIGLQSLGLDLLTKGGSTIGSVGPAISLPIFNGGRLRAELRGSEAAYDEAVALYNQTLNQALREVADAFLSRKSLVPRLAKAQEAYDAASEAHRITLNRYKGGLSNYIEVLSAQDNLLVSLRSLTDLQSRAFALDVSLIKALGGGYQSNNS